MSKFGWLVVGLALLAAVGCGPKGEEKLSPEEAAKRAGLRRDQFSPNAKGNQTIEGADGSKTELLGEEDLGKYGLELYPGATAKEGTAYLKTDPKSVTVFYSLLTSDPAANVTKFYEKQLGGKAVKSGDTGMIVTGKLKNGKASVVTVVDEGDKGSRAEVQILGSKPE